jgi:acetyltransferase
MVGATEDLSKFGGRCMRQTIDFGFKGNVYPINPKRETIFGQRCFASIADLPEAPDHVGIVLPAHAVPTALEQCAARGVPFVTIFSSGFGELGTDEGRAAQQRLVDIAALVFNQPAGFFRAGDGVESADENVAALERVCRSTRE